MKRIYYFLAFIAVATAFSACNPLDNSYKQLGGLPVPQAPAPAPVNVNATITLTATDYALLPTSNAANTALSFKANSNALTDIPTILAAKYTTAADKSTAVVTYALTPAPYFKPADSLFADVAYTVVNPTDYVAAQGTTGTTFKDYSDAQVLLYLKFKYPTPVANQLSVLTYTYFLSGVTASSGNLVTDSFIYLNGAWTKIYTVSPAQYASVGHGSFNQFVVGDLPATILGYFNVFLKNDATVASTAKVGDVKYVSYNYYTSSTKVTSQRVQSLTFDGVNWVATPLMATVSFTKTSGTWTPTPTGSGPSAYTLLTADYQAISKIANIASASAIANLASFNNFSLTGATAWTDDQVNAGIAAALKTDFPAATKGQQYTVTYSAYNGATVTLTKLFTFDGTNFVFGTGVVTVTGTPYTLTAADLTFLGNSTFGTATAAQKANVAKYGDFDATWALADIKAGIILVLAKDFPTATANTVYSVTYLAYVSSADVPTVLSFTYNGTTWIAN